uniref:Superoxide dismutase copper/zinc binding domain-containing protein n=1 Tax=Taeniopygia guttata TaxID=59729 RepID=A0A674HE59_TAEGU
MSCQGCADAVRAALDAAPGETPGPSPRPRGHPQGFGGPPRAPLSPPGGAAVAALGGPGGVRGLLRFLQLSPGRCIVDGAVTGLPPGPHGLHIHEFGDLSDPCDSCGGHFNPDGETHGGPQDEHRVSWGCGGGFGGGLGGVLGAVRGFAGVSGGFGMVWDIIGRSVVVAEGEDDLGRGSHPLSRVTGNSGRG